MGATLICALILQAESTSSDAQAAAPARRRLLAAGEPSAGSWKQAAEQRQAQRNLIACQSALRGWLARPLPEDLRATGLESARRWLLERLAPPAVVDGHNPRPRPFVPSTRVQRVVCLTQ